MAFQAEQKVKGQILTCLGTDQLFRLLADTDVNVLMKTLGLLRNLLSNKPVRVYAHMALSFILYFKHSFIHICLFVVLFIEVEIL